MSQYLIVVNINVVARLKKNSDFIVILPTFKLNAIHACMLVYVLLTSTKYGKYLQTLFIWVIDPI